LPRGNSRLYFLLSAMSPDQIVLAIPNKIK
jgi:hypothetical protein